jgi:hypothetical protein
MRRLLVVVGLVGAAVFPALPAHAGGGCHGDTVPSGSGTTVALEMNCMNPRVLHAAGNSAEITFVNRDQVTHNLYGDGWSVDELAAAKSITRVFAPGTHVYACTIHPGMAGALVVGDGVGAVQPVRAVRDAGDSSSAGWLLVALAGVVVGSAGTVGLRRVRTR